MNDKPKNPDELDKKSRIDKDKAAEDLEKTLILKESPGFEEHDDTVLFDPFTEPGHNPENFGTELSLNDLDELLRTHELAKEGGTEEQTNGKSRRVLHAHEMGDSSEQKTVELSAWDDEDSESDLVHIFDDEPSVAAKDESNQLEDTLPYAEVPGFIREGASSGKSQDYIATDEVDAVDHTTPDHEIRNSIRIPLILGSAALIFAVIATWFGFRATSQLDNLKAKISALNDAQLTSAAQVKQQQQEVQNLLMHTDELDQRVDGLTRVMSEVLTSKQLRSSETPTSSNQVSAASKSKAPVKASGEWVINLMSVHSPEAAKNEVKKLRNLGLKADTKEVTLKGKTWYRIRAIGFVTKEEAQLKSEQIASQLGIKDAWVDHR